MSSLAPLLALALLCAGPGAEVHDVVDMDVFCVPWTDGAGHPRQQVSYGCMLRDRRIVTVTRDYPPFAAWGARPATAQPTVAEMIAIVGREELGSVVREAEAEGRRSKPRPAVAA
jgi:hypothetical protein